MLAKRAYYSRSTSAVKPKVVQTAYSLPLLAPGTSPYVVDFRYSSPQTDRAAWRTAALIFHRPTVE